MVVGYASEGHARSDWVESETWVVLVREAYVKLRYFHDALPTYATCLVLRLEFRLETSICQSQLKNVQTNARGNL